MVMKLFEPALMNLTWKIPDHLSPGKEELLRVGWDPATAENNSYCPQS